MKLTIKADWGLGAIGYLDPVPTFHPPSLRKAPKVKLTKLMKRLMEEKKNSIDKFHHTLLLNQPRNVSMPVNMGFINMDQLNLPPLYSSAATKKNK